MRSLALGQRPLTAEDYEAVVYGTADVHLADLTALDAHRAVLDHRIDAGDTIYSVTTGYGADASQAVPVGALGHMQENTVRSHAVGVGPPVPDAVSRGMLLLVANAAATGPPAVNRAIAEALVGALQRREQPSVPAIGSQSASDLVPGAHLALALLPENGGPAFGPKDGSIVNNTAFTTALAWHATRSVQRCIERAEHVAALTLQALLGHPDAYDERLIRQRPHPGALAAAAHMRTLLAGSRLLRGPGRPHDPFSLRCLPQVHGAVRDTLTHAQATLRVELAAVTDNPVVLTGPDEVLSGGNFHGEPLAIPLDALALAVTELGALSQRRTQHLVTADLAGMTTPPRLTRHPADSLGLLMLPSLAAALVSESRLRTQAATRESIPVDVMEDHVSMAALAARQVLDGTELTRHVLAAELTAAAQALDFHDITQASIPAQELHCAVRERVASLDTDRPIDVTALLDLV